MSEHDETWKRVHAAYLERDDPRGQSGFRGDEAAWRTGREPILEAFDRDGTLLDIGCANGLLMESLAGWATERGFRIEPFGLELSADLAAIARNRLPHWRDRIVEGDARSWSPPRRFDYVRTELVYAPEDEWRGYVERLLASFTMPSGRLIVCAYGSMRRNDPAVPVDELLGGWGFSVAGSAEARDEHGFPITRVAWIDGEDRQSEVRRIP